MKTCTALILLISISLSVQDPERMEDFYHTVRSKTLSNGKTLMDCPEDCSPIGDEHGQECVCITLTKCKDRKKWDFIKSDLQKLGLDPKTMRRTYWCKSKDLDIHLSYDVPISPSTLLKKIERAIQKSNAEMK